MTKSRILIAALLAAAVAVAFLFWTALNRLDGLHEEKIKETLSDLRYLQLAIQTYAADSPKTTGHLSYPSSIGALVKENYLNSSDLDDLNHPSSIEYIPPAPSAPKSTIILRTRIENQTLTAPLEGPPQAK